MARSGVRDPLDKFRWTVSIEGFSKLGFMTCSTPQVTINTKDYPEGGNHLNPRKIVEGASYAPVTLTRGLTNDTSFVKWINGIFDVIQSNSGISNTTESDPTSKLIGAVTDNGASAIGNLNNETSKYRKTVKIEHCNRAGQVEAVYFLYNAFPIDYKPASDFDAMADDGVSIESITLGYEGCETKFTGISGFVGNIVAKKFL
jgi:phage tail-like protein